ncbi:MAG: hypothetical protein LBT13_01360 [Treponema sp.]|jgi:hypothetical protein|nr:hypothetical protein [Treponema sp.]
MSCRKSLLLAVLLSLGLGACMVSLALGYLPREPGEKYAVLRVDASYPDKLIGDTLSGGLGGRYPPITNYLSESTQWVFLDDFGALAQIPLEEYRERIETFDPRDDGYAQRLQAFFVRDGKRLFFIPFSRELMRGAFKTTRTDIHGVLSTLSAWWNTSGIGLGKPPGIVYFEQSLTAALGDIPFSIEYLGRAEEPLLFYCILFALAAVVSLFLSDAPLITAALFPSLGAFVCAGPLGLTLAAALTALFSALTQPLRELLVSLRYGYKDRPAKRPWFLSLVYVLLYGILCCMGKIPPVLGIMDLVCCFAVFWASLFAESNQGKDHVRFTPVTIMEEHPAFFPRTIIPFALVSFQALLVPRMLGNVNPYHQPASLEDHFLCVIDATEYERHAMFQASFSITPLGDGDASTYVRYYIGEDGLITGAYTQALPVYDDIDKKDKNQKKQEIPPFPLAGLMEFLGNSAHTDAQHAPGSNTTEVPEFIPETLVLGFCIPAIFQRKQGKGKKKKMLVYNDKRIAA